jgi:hypothetical protein
VLDWRLNEKKERERERERDPHPSFRLLHVYGSFVSQFNVGPFPFTLSKNEADGHATKKTKKMKIVRGGQKQVLYDLGI